MVFFLVVITNISSIHLQDPSSQPNNPTPTALSLATMSSIAHMLAHSADHAASSNNNNNSPITATNNSEENTHPLTAEIPSESTLETSSSQSPSITIDKSDSQSTIKAGNNSMTPRNSALEDMTLSKDDEIRPSTNKNSSTLSTHPITPAIRTSVDLSAESNEITDPSDPQIKHQRKRSKVSRACDEVS